MSAIIRITSPLPSLLLMFFVFIMSRNKKKPIKLLILLAAFGMTSVGPIYLLEDGALMIFSNIFSAFTIITDFLECLFTVAIIEEGAKWIVLYLCTWKNKAFDHTFNGILFSVFVSLGMAAMENIKCLFTASWSSAIIRAICSVPGHMAFAVCMGLFYYKAKQASLLGHKHACRIYTVLSFVIPTMLHTIFNFLFMLKSDFNLSMWVGFTYAAIMIIASIILIIVCSIKNKPLAVIEHIDHQENLLATQ